MYVYFPPSPPPPLPPCASPPVTGLEVEVVGVSDPSLLAPAGVTAVTLDFKVLHPVVITRLGVFPGGPDQEIQGNMTVKLLQLDQEVGLCSRTRR